MYVLKIFSATTPSPYYNAGSGFISNSKIIDTIKSTVGYGNGMHHGRESKHSWLNDNPFTTTSTIAPITTDKVTPTQTAMLEVFQWLYTSTFKPIVNSVTTMVSSTPETYITDKDEWGNSIQKYRVDEPPHVPGLSLEFKHHILFAAVALLFCEFYIIECSLHMQYDSVDCHSLFFCMCRPCLALNFSLYLHSG